MLTSHEELTLGELREQLNDLPDETIVRVSLFAADYDTQTFEVCGNRQVFAVDVAQHEKVVFIGAMKNILDEGLFD